ncbi:MAG: hypothetical protein P4L85_21480 [Paludisphaera borealis]|uniref:hypothetical protein n=1 Tax=Paludisphaera borealis TaxID=1387353 RepID=UPI0028482209|nr:hypothetical protein [Paludisphaera borealis]MDR3621938.1 hypothetical protein [Paludisphaera borealis]
MAESMEEAGRLLEVVEPQLIVVHVDGEEFSYEQFDLLLWANSVSQRPAPVLVMVNGYSTEQATILFRMGVEEYLCEAEHGDRLDSIVDGLIARAPAGRRSHEVHSEAAATAKPAFRLPVVSALA